MNTFFCLKKQPMVLRGNFLRYKWNKVALDSFLTGNLLTHDFGVAIAFISVNKEFKCNSIDVSNKDMASSVFGISKSTWWNLWYQSRCIIETFTKLSWKLEKVDGNVLNMKRNMYMLLMIKSSVSTMLFLLFTKSHFIFFVRRTLPVGYGV